MARAAARAPVEYSGAPGAKPTSRSAWPAMARTQRPMARFSGSVGASLRFGPLDIAAQLSATLAALSGSSSPKLR